MTATDEILRDPEWLPHRHVADADAIRFRRVARERHGAVPFLTDDCLAGDDERVCDIPIDICLQAVAPGPVHFIFHSAFSGSTLLARALDRPGMAMGLSEPVLLNDVVGLRRRGAGGAEVARLADCALRLLGRPFASDEAVVIKPSNVINPLADLLLAMAPASRAVFLFSPLETFLTSVARKGLACRLWARELAEGYLTDAYFAPLGLAAHDLFRQSDLQIAASAWLAQMRHFTLMRGGAVGDRIMPVDADSMLAAPAEAIAAVARHFGLPLAAADAEAIASGPAFARHSKTGSDYSAARREEDYAAVRAAHRDEIERVAEWTRTFAVSLDIPLDAIGAPQSSG